MKAAIVSVAGELPVYGDFPEPQADENHVVVTVKAAAVSQLAKARAAGTHYSATTQ
jgi:NADPH:quinone reductase-like Zn-dependent oxidoreductase